MEMRLLSKKGFAFTFLAFFLSMVILIFLHLSIMDGDYTKSNVFKESRISFVDNELKYFKQTYLPNAVSYSLYNTIAALQEYSRDPVNYAKFQQNYSMFNEFLFTGMKYGSFNGTLQPMLYDDNRTVTYFLELFRDDFNNNFKGNFTFEILNINVFEEKPYYITARLYTNLSVTTEDNISSWSSLEFIDVAVPIYDLYDPLFLIMEGENVILSASEFNFPAQNWTVENFEEALEFTYSTVYYEPNHMYTLGDSFLNRFLNVSSHSYKDVLAFWSFDYDVERGGVYDTSGFTNLSSLYGNSRMIFDFDNETFIGNIVPDLSDYENNGTLVGDVDCNVFGVSGTGCEFDGDGDYIVISRDDLNLNSTNVVSISAWIYPRGYVDLISGSGSEIFRYGNTPANVLDLRLSPAGKLIMEVGDHTDGSHFAFISNSNVTLNKWSHVVGTFDGDTGIGKLFIDGFLDYAGVSDNMTHFDKSNANIGVGNQPLAQECFNGYIDELGVYSKVLSDFEIAMLYKEKSVLHLDYIEAFHGKGVLFDGNDDYVNIEQEIFDNPIGDFSVELWFRTNSVGYAGGDVIFSLPYGAGSGDLLLFALMNNNNYTFYSTHAGIGQHNMSVAYNFRGNKNYHIVNSFDGANKRIYINGFLVKEAPVGNAFGVSMRNITIGADDDGPAGRNKYFSGVIDEVKIYNYSLSDKEVMNYYYNYDSLAKGCCNYITLVDPHKFGYDNVLYETNTSYSSKMFYNYHRRGIQPSIVLWNISTITSYNPANRYYNFILDQCMVEAYNVLDYMNETLSVDYHKQTGVDSGSCSRLVEYGFY